MLFTSPIFLFVFLPLVLGMNFLLPKRWRNAWLMVTSLWFYSWGEGRLVFLMLFSSLADYVAGLGISNGWRRQPQALTPGGHRTRSQRWWLVASLSVNIGILLWFKYTNFTVENINILARTFGLTSGDWLPALNIILPLGISFYTFQSMSYTIDVYRGDVPATRNIISYITFVTMFHQLVAGPIVRYADIAKELIQRTVTRPQFTEGIRRFMVGMAKKMLVANTVAVAADEIFSARAGELGRLDAWFGVLCYSLQIYFDFAGYSDMAIGLGKMFGFTFLENFNYPYIAQSVQDFWRRWHMSMSTWFRDYLYRPLGGNRQGAARTYINLLAVFFVTGLWHGANWTFVVWGLWHGLFLFIERLGFGRLLLTLWQPLRHLYVLLVVGVGWVLFRADSLPQALALVRVMFIGGPGTWQSDVISNPQIWTAVIIGCVASTPLVVTLGHQWSVLANRLGQSRVAVALQSLFLGSQSLIETVAILVLFGLSVMRLAGDTYNPFIYFRF